MSWSHDVDCAAVLTSELFDYWLDVVQPNLWRGTHTRGWRELIFHLILRSFSPPLTHHYLLMVLELQAKVVPLDEVHVGAHQVQQHLARGFLL